ncbi:MAG: 1,4-alpha-glucan branching protein GlgB, partial [Clostridia bacterium]
YAVHNETRPGTASKVYDINGYLWNDKKWINKREKTDLKTNPFNIYELHLGSWKKFEDGNVFSYEQYAKELVKYIKQMGYTHIELMPVGEYPFDKSWGYQVTGYFSPTSRYGTPKDFMKFVDILHQNDIGVILDWVPAHFPKDAFGLYKFDGTFCYEYENPLKGEHPDWGTVIFNYDKNEVVSFLISSACNWLETYHIDGLRVDAVASMLYLDYGRKDGQWEPNKFGKNGNLEAIEFFKKLNTEVARAFKGVVMIAEESTAWPKVTAPVKEDGLGFNFKWNMGWMNDTVKYISTDPLFRMGCHNNLTFSFDYAFAENYILPLSHDEVVHGKASLIGKMPGDYGLKFDNLKAYFGYMYSHPGKKLLFMGCEFAQFIEWNEEKQLDWFLLEYLSHEEFQKFVMGLNFIYKKYSPLWQCDHFSDGFQWISGDNSDQNIICYLRYDKNKNAIVSISNFSSLRLSEYKIGVPYKGKYKQIFNSAEMFFEPEDCFSKNEIFSKKGEVHGFENQIDINLPPFSTIYLYKKFK